MESVLGGGVMPSRAVAQQAAAKPRQETGGGGDVGIVGNEGGNGDADVVVAASGQSLL